MHRRASSDVPSSITLDHGDLLVTNGSAQLECAHRTVSGLQGPRVHLTCRWVTHHSASCPVAGVVGCVLPSCVQGSAEPSSRSLGVGENKWILFWGSVLFLSTLVFFLLVNTWIRNWKGASSQLSTSVPPGGALPFEGSCPLGWETALATVTTLPFSPNLFFPLFSLFKGEEGNYALFKGMVYFCCILLNMLVTKREPTLVTMMQIRWVPPKWAFWAKSGRS